METVDLLIDRCAALENKDNMAKVQ